MNAGVKDFPESKAKAASSSKLEVEVVLKSPPPNLTPFPTFTLASMRGVTRVAFPDKTGHNETLRASNPPEMSKLNSKLLQKQQPSSASFVSMEQSRSDFAFAEDRLEDISATARKTNQLPASVEVQEGIFESLPGCGIGEVAVSLSTVRGNLKTEVEKEKKKNKRQQKKKVGNKVAPMGDDVVTKNEIDSIVESFQALKMGPSCNKMLSGGESINQKAKESISTRTSGGKRSEKESIFEEFWQPEKVSKGLKVVLN